MKNIKFISNYAKLKKNWKENDWIKDIEVKEINDKRANNLEKMEGNIRGKLLFI